MTTRELIEAVNSSPEKWDSALGFENLVGIEDYDALRAATLAVLDDLGNSGAFNGHSGNQGLANDDCLICRAVDNARALRERL